MSRHLVSASVGAAICQQGGVAIPTPGWSLAHPPPHWPSPHLAAAGAARSELVLIAGHAVVSALVGHKGTGAQRLLTAAAQEAVLMPRLASVFQLPGPCGEQGSHSEAVSQAPECHPLLPPVESPRCSLSLSRVASTHLQQDSCYLYGTCDPPPQHRTCYAHGWAYARSP